MPPVDVPATRSKCPAMELPGPSGAFQIGKHGSRENSADAAAIDREDAKVPVRRPTLRNAARRDAAGGSGEDGLVVGHSDLRGVVGMLTAAGPMAVDQPALVEEQPFGRPRDDGLGDQPVGLPIHRPRVVQAERPARGRSGVRVDVRRLLAGAPRVETDHRVEHLDRDPRVGDHRAGEIHPREVGDPDLVRSGERPQRSPPHP